MGEDIPDEQEELKWTKWYRAEFDGYEMKIEQDCSGALIDSGCCCVQGVYIHDYYLFQQECKSGGIMCVNWDQRLTRLTGPWDTCAACMAANPDCRKCVPLGPP